MKVSIPPELIKDVETIDFTIKTLKIIKRIKNGKTVDDLNSVPNLLKYYLLGYIYSKDADVAQLLNLEDVEQFLHSDIIHGKNKISKCKMAKWCIRSHLRCDISHHTLPP